MNKIFLYQNVISYIKTYKKMKRNIISMLFLLSGGILLHAQYYPVDTLTLNTSYRALQSAPGTQKQQMAFFNAFPGSWNEYIGTYQYVDDHSGIGKKTIDAGHKHLKYDLTMYRLAPAQVELMKNKMNLVNDDVYCAKVVNLAIGAKLDADAPNYLQSLEHVAMWESTDAMMKTISQLTDADKMQYWQFFWSSIHVQQSRQNEYEKLRGLLSEKYPEETEIMAIAFKYFYGKSVFQSENHINQRKYVQQNNKE